jgi:hypothetical protein
VLDDDFNDDYQLADAVAEVYEGLASIFNVRVGTLSRSGDPEWLRDDLEAFVGGASPTRDVRERIAEQVEGLSSESRRFLTPQQFQAQVRVEARHRREHGRARSRAELEAVIATLAQER